MKILYVTTIGGSMSFFPEHFKMLLEKGHTVELACNLNKPLPSSVSELGLKAYDLPFSRSPFSKNNISAYKQLKRLLKAERYDVVHCHTPNAAAITRLACRKLRKKGLKVFYTAHGFHFYEGAPLKNWLIYYSIEKLCARMTDTLITINTEDFALAKKKLHAKKVVYVPGIGLDTDRFENTAIEKNEKRKKLGIPCDVPLILSVGELNENKNHEIVLRALATVENKQIHYAIAGEGEKKEYLLSLAKELGLSPRFHLLGFQNNIAEIYRAADIYALPSIREGLNVSVMEAMASSLPCMIGKIRGNVDLIDENGGALFDPISVNDCAKAITALLASDLYKMGLYNREKVQNFSKDIVLSALKKIYEEK